MSSPSSSTATFKSEQQEREYVDLTRQLEMDLSQAAGNFADDLVRLVVPPSHSQNALVSPLSILTALSMLLLGSKTTSRTGLMTALRLPSNVSQSQVDTYYHTLLSAYKANANANEKLLINNMALVKSGQALLPEYTEAIRNKYSAQIDQVNFQTEGDAIVDTVNSWVNQSTQGLIPTLLDGPPDSETVLMLLNALYFEGKWAYRLRFPHDEKFDVSDSINKTATFITTTESFLYLEVPAGSDGKVIQMIELPYLGSSSMVMILPPKSQTVNSLFSQRSTYDLVNKLYSEGSSRPVRLYMPKFKFSVKTPLNQHLTSLGAGDVFTNSADLSGITGEANLKVSSIKHLTAIEVDELGTKAAAVTSIEIVPMSAVVWEQEPLELRLNRPFAFVIYDKKAKLPIFVGKLNDPTN